MLAFVLIIYLLVNSTTGFYLAGVNNNNNINIPTTGNNKYVDHHWQRQIISNVSSNSKRNNNLVVLNMASSSDNNNDDDNNDGIGKVISSLWPPTLEQLAFLAFAVVSATNLIESSIPSGDITRIGINACFFLYSSYSLYNGIKGIEYSELEDLDQKSLARQAGKWALRGEVPTTYDDDDDECYEVATFAGGCFWGTELHYQRIPGVIATCVGYTQGSTIKPTYSQVCSGNSGHTEGIQLLYDPKICSYSRLLNKLFDTLDPTKLNQVKNDRGTQYRHGIYTHTQEQAEMAMDVRSERQRSYSDPIVTEMKPATVFWPAENYHQRYLGKGGQSTEKDCEETVRCYG